jgi:hypothetical protein
MIHYLLPSTNLKCKRDNQLNEFKDKNRLIEIQELILGIIIEKC